MEFYTKWNRPKSDAEKGGGKKVVETAGYITVKQQVDNLMIAGDQLESYRRAKYRYDFEDEDSIDENYHDPTRDPGFDITDVTEADAAVTQRIEKVVDGLEEEKQRIADEEALQAEKDKEELALLREEKRNKIVE